LFFVVPSGLVVMYGLARQPGCVQVAIGWMVASGIPGTLVTQRSPARMLSTIRRRSKNLPSLVQGPTMWSCRPP
jgi:hypothetical protein